MINSKSLLAIFMLTWLTNLFGCEKKPSVFDELPPLNLDQDRELFFPILRDYEPGDEFSELVIHRPIAEGLAVFACRRIPRPNGNIGIDYVMKRSLDTYGISEDSILSACYENFFAANIRVNATEEDGERYFEFTSDKDLVAAILGHESTYEKFTELTDSKEIAILVLSPDAIAITCASSSFASNFSNVALEHSNPNDPVDLTPAVYYWTATGELVPETSWKKKP